MHFIYSFGGFPSAIALQTAQNHWEIPNGRCTAFGWTNTYKFLCVCVHVRQADYDYRLFIPLLFATKTHVARGRVFGLVLIPCLQLISHDFIHVYSQEKLFNAFKCKQASDESTQTPPNTHRYVYVYIRTRMTTIKGRNIFPFFFIPFSFHRLRPLSDLYLLK